jgi:hypothetical protein
MWGQGGTSIVKALLGVELFKFSDGFIYELRQKRKNQNKVFKYLPEYTINTNKEANGRPVEAYWFHQWVGSYKEEKENKKEYLYFDLNSLDRHLNEEISQSGYESFFEEFDFEKILSVFTPASGDDYLKHGFPTINYLIVELTYITSYDHDGNYDCEMYVDIPGYLDNNFEVKKYEFPVHFPK